jgi:hypothetical protein
MFYCRWKEVDAVRMLSIAETCERLGGLAIKTLRDPRWSSRVGLPIVHVGRRVGFLETDIASLIERGRERL